MKKVKAGKFSFSDPVWASISDQGKDFITALLTKDKDKRPSAEDALKLPWIQQAAEKQKEAVSKDAGMSALSNLGKFTATSKLK